MRFLLTLVLSLLLAFPAQAGVEFDDVDDSINLTSNIEPSSQIVIHIRFRKDDTDNDPLFIHWDWNSGSPYGYNLGTRASLGLQFFAGDGTANNPCIEANAYSTGVVEDWIFTNNAGTCDLFRNGADQSMSDSATKSTMTYGGSMSGTKIGIDGSTFLDAGVMLLEVWEATTLTSQEKLLLSGGPMGTGLQIQPGNLLLAVYLDECPEGSSCDGFTIYDRSGNDNHLTVDDGANNTGATGVYTNTESYP